MRWRVVVLIMSGQGCMLSPTEGGRIGPGAVQIVSNEFQRLARSATFGWNNVTGAALLSEFGLSTSVGASALRSCFADTTGIATANAAGVPTDITLTYSIGDCASSGFSITQTVRGTIRIQDLGDRFAARATYTDLEFALSAAGIVTEWTLNGTIEFRAVDDTTLQVHRRLTEAERVSAQPSTSYWRSDDLIMTLVDSGPFVSRPVGNRFRPHRVSWSGVQHVVLESTPGDSLRIAYTTRIPFVPQLFCLSGYSAGEVTGVATGTQSGMATLRYSC